MPPPSRRRDLDIARLAQQRNHHHHHPHPHHNQPSPSSSSSRPHHDHHHHPHRPVVLFDPEYSLHECFLEFHGPAESPYAHGVWYLHLYLPAEYPFSSPSIGFQNKILHPNIDEASGSICLDVINQTWTPLYSLENIVDCFVPQLLRYANPSDPLNPAAAALAVQRNNNTATGAGTASSSSSGLREGYSEAFWSAVKTHMSQHATREAAERALPPRYRSVLQQQQQQETDSAVSAAASSAAIGTSSVVVPPPPLSPSSTSPSSSSGSGGSEVTPNRSTTPTPLFVVSDHHHHHQVSSKHNKTTMGTGGVEESPSGLSAMDSSEEYEPEPLDV